MGLLKESPSMVFDLDTIGKGFLVSAKHNCWTEAKVGIVSAVKPEELTVIFLPGIANVTNFFLVPAVEVAEGLWQLRWSKDLTQTESYPAEGGSNEV